MSVAPPLPIGFVSFFKMETSALGFAKITCNLMKAQQPTTLGLHNAVQQASTLRHHKGHALSCPIQMPSL